MLVYGDPVLACAQPISSDQFELFTHYCTWCLVCGNPQRNNNMKNPPPPLLFWQTALHCPWLYFTLSSRWSRATCMATLMVTIWVNPVFLPNQLKVDEEVHFAFKPNVSHGCSSHYTHMLEYMAWCVLCRFSDEMGVWFIPSVADAHWRHRQKVSQQTQT